MDIRAALNLVQLHESVAWLTMPAIDLVDEVMSDKILHGEDLDENDEEARDQVLSEIVQAQSDFRAVVHDGKITVHRAIVVPVDWIEALQPGAELGESWSYDIRGAFPYNGARDPNKVVVVFSGVVDAHDVDWGASIAMHSSGEAEIRLRPYTNIELTSMSIKKDHAKFGALIKKLDVKAE